MIIKPNAQELTNTSSNLGIEVFVLDDRASKKFIRRAIEKFKPNKVTGHLSIGRDSITIPLEKYEFTYSKSLYSESAFIFFDQESGDRNTVVEVKDARLIGDLMENSYGMEYFISNNNLDYLIAINWYVIEVSGSIIKFFSKINEV
ncbi:hypothetical protein [Cohnella sp. WQ 127256]|uniref:hypothetical protein n=1 Tax=Cohnella sp. WQ 127256 TaxID=2938790 RepID=UPI002118E32C|nr:hypothetical protein [Cohnella sp. WQ 127256]